MCCALIGTTFDHFAHNQRIEGGDEFLCVLNFEILRASNSCCDGSRRVSSDPELSVSIAVVFASSVFRKRTGPSAARRSDVDAEIRRSKRIAPSRPAILQREDGTITITPRTGWTGRGVSLCRSLRYPHLREPGEQQMIRSVPKRWTCGLIRRGGHGLSRAAATICNPRVPCRFRR